MVRVAPTNRRAILLAVFIAFGASLELDFIPVVTTKFCAQEVITVNQYIFCEGSMIPMLRCVANRMQKVITAETRFSVRL